MTTKNLSRPIYRDGRLVGYTPAASPHRRLVALVRDALRVPWDEAARVVRQLTRRPA
jgi:hypothetical protein